MAFEERREPERLDAEQLGGNPGIEDVGDSPAVILVKETEVVVGVMEYDLDVPRFQQIPELVGGLDLQRIDDRVLPVGGELEQVNPSVFPVVPVPFVFYLVAARVKFSGWDMERGSRAYDYHGHMWS